MNCKQATHSMCDYLEGSLDTLQTRLIERHIHSCKNCQQVIATARETLRVYFPSDPPRLFGPRARTQTA